MFGWGKKKTAKPEDTHAYQLGADMGRQMGDAVNEFIEPRFATVGDGYLNVLRDRLRLCFDDTRAPPIVLARIEYNIFKDNVIELKSKMPDEFQMYLSDWYNAADIVGIRTDLDQLIAQRVGDFSSNLLLRGLNVMTNEYGDALISADAAWRSRYPERAAQFPKEPS